MFGRRRRGGRSAYRVGFKHGHRAARRRRGGFGRGVGRQRVGFRF